MHSDRVAAAASSIRSQAFADNLAFNQDIRLAFSSDGWHALLQTCVMPSLRDTQCENAITALTVYLTNSLEDNGVPLLGNSHTENGVELDDDGGDAIIVAELREAWIPTILSRPVLAHLLVRTAVLPLDIQAQAAAAGFHIPSPPTAGAGTHLHELPTEIAADLFLCVVADIATTSPEDFRLFADALFLPLLEASLVEYRFARNSLTEGSITTEELALSGAFEDSAMSGFLENAAVTNALEDLAGLVEEPVGAHTLEDAMRQADLEFGSPLHFSEANMAIGLDGWQEGVGGPQGDNFGAQVDVFGTQIDNVGAYINGADAQLDNAHALLLDYADAQIDVAFARFVESIPQVNDVAFQTVSNTQDSLHLPAGDIAWDLDVLSTDFLDDAGIVGASDVAGIWSSSSISALFSSVDAPPSSIDAPPSSFAAPSSPTFASMFAASSSPVSATMFAAPTSPLAAPSEPFASPSKYVVRPYQSLVTPSTPSMPSARLAIPFTLSFMPLTPTIRSLLYFPTSLPQDVSPARSTISSLHLVSPSSRFGSPTAYPRTPTRRLATAPQATSLSSNAAVTPSNAAGPSNAAATPSNAVASPSYSVSSSTASSFTTPNEVKFISFPRYPSPIRAMEMPTPFRTWATPTSLRTRATPTPSRTRVTPAGTPCSLFGPSPPPSVQGTPVQGQGGSTLAAPPSPSPAGSSSTDATMMLGDRTITLEDTTTGPEDTTITLEDTKNLFADTMMLLADTTVLPVASSTSSGTDSTTSMMFSAAALSSGSYSAGTLRSSSATSSGSSSGASSSRSSSAASSSSSSSVPSLSLSSQSFSSFALSTSSTVLATPATSLATGTPSLKFKVMTLETSAGASPAEILARHRRALRPVSRLGVASRGLSKVDTMLIGDEVEVSSGFDEQGGLLGVGARRASIGVSERRMIFEGGDEEVSLLLPGRAVSFDQEVAAREDKVVDSGDGVSNAAYVNIALGIVQQILQNPESATGDVHGPQTNSEQALKSDGRTGKRKRQPSGDDSSTSSQQPAPEPAPSPLFDPLLATITELVMQSGDTKAYQPVAVMNIYAYSSNLLYRNGVWNGEFLKAWLSAVTSRASLAAMYGPLNRLRYGDAAWARKRADAMDDEQRADGFLLFVRALHKYNARRAMMAKREAELARVSKSERVSWLQLWRTFMPLSLMGQRGPQPVPPTFQEFMDTLYEPLLKRALKLYKSERISRDTYQRPFVRFCDA
ncbi:hypothetical protein HDZ31DRAFT_67401 [Schizophyllum fasciatum]